MRLFEHIIGDMGSFRKKKKKKKKGKNLWNLEMLLQGLEPRTSVAFL
jgi:hypothetical protein